MAPPLPNSAHGDPLISAKPRGTARFLSDLSYVTRWRRTGWLGRRDSNLRISESEFVKSFEIAHRFRADWAKSSRPETFSRIGCKHGVRHPIAGSSMLSCAGYQQQHSSGLRSMRIRLKGINPKRKRLADGTFRTYYHAWKGGPRLRGEPGTPEFVHSYNAAIATKAATPQGRLVSVLQAYQASGEFNGLAARTRFDYIGRIKVIESEFGDFPKSALTDRRTRGIFMAWRDKLAAKSRRQAELYVVGVCPRLVVGA
jgi:hypothetical protein